MTRYHRAKRATICLSAWLVMVVACERKPDVIGGHTTGSAHQGMMIDAPPFLDLGTIEGTSVVEFSPNYTPIVVSTADDDLIVTDRFRVLVFNQSGVLLWEAGRDGDGPGEFRNIGFVCELAPDTVLVHSLGKPTFTLLTSRGTDSRDVSLPPDRRASLAACSSGSVLLRTKTGRSPSSYIETFLLMNAQGTLTGDSVNVRVPSSRLVTVEASVSNCQDGFMIGSGDKPAISIYDRRLRWAGDATWSANLLKISDTDRNAIQKANSSNGVTSAPADPVTTQENWPAYARAFCDPTGRMWIQEQNGIRGPGSWKIRDGTGDSLATFAPTAFGSLGRVSLIGVGSQSLFAYYRDNDGAVRLVGWRYRLM